MELVVSPISGRGSCQLNQILTIILMYVIVRKVEPAPSCSVEFLDPLAEDESVLFLDVAGKGYLFWGADV